MLAELKMLLELGPGMSMIHLRSMYDSDHLLHIHHVGDIGNLLKRKANGDTTGTQADGLSFEFSHY